MDEQSKMNENVAQEQSTDQEQAEGQQQGSDQEQSEGQQQDSNQEQSDDQAQGSNQEQAEGQQQGGGKETGPSPLTLTQVLDLLKKSNLINLDMPLKSLFEQVQNAQSGLPSDWGIIGDSGYLVLMWKRKDG